MLWLALPKKTKSPKTQRELAAKLGVNESTLSDWKLKDGFKAEVKRMAVALLDDDVPEIIAKMVAQAKSGSQWHQQTILEMAGVHKQQPSGGVTVNLKGYTSVNPDDWDPESRPEH